MLRSCLILRLTAGILGMEVTRGVRRRVKSVCTAVGLVCLECSHAPHYKGRILCVTLECSGEQVEPSGRPGGRRVVFVVVVAAGADPRLNSGSLTHDHATPLLRIRPVSRAVPREAPASRTGVTSCASLTSPTARFGRVTHW